METMTKRRRMSISLPEYAVEDIRKEAKRTGGSVSALAATYILDAMYHTPNAETLAAIEESKAGIYAGTIDTSSMEAFKKSMGI